jgi:hypothetical protein
MEITSKTSQKIFFLSMIQNTIFESVIARSESKVLTLDPIFKIFFKSQ